VKMFKCDLECQITLAMPLYQVQILEEALTLRNGFFTQNRGCGTYQLTFDHFLINSETLNRTTS